jgi:uncharacterized protein YcfJ
MKIIKNILLISALVLSVSHAKSYTKTKYIKVTKSYKTTIWKKKEVPYQKCYYENVPVQYTAYEDVYEKNPAAPIIGGVVGGVVGHQFGGGRGKDLATVVGALAGGTIANNQYGTKHYKRPVTRTRYEQRQVCHTYYKTKRYRVTRWKNIGYYKGKRIVKTTKHRLRRIPVRVRVSY